MNVDSSTPDGYIIKTLPSAESAGEWYQVNRDFNFSGFIVRRGDKIMAKAAGAAGDNTNWDILRGN